MYEHFYGQGQNSEYIRYLDGFNNVLDKHIDTGQPGQLWVIPYLLEGKECQRIDALGHCTLNEADLLLNELEESNTDDQTNTEPTTYIEKPKLSEQLAQNDSGNAWFSSLFNKLKG